MEVIRYQAKGQAVRHGLLVTTGRKWTHIILVDHPIRIVRVLNKEQDNMEVMNYKVSKATRVIKRMAQSYYGTMRKAPKNVRKVL
jgi:hypothetical protein